MSSAGLVLQLMASIRLFFVPKKQPDAIIMHPLHQVVSFYSLVSSLFSSRLFHPDIIVFILLSSKFRSTLFWKKSCFCCYFSLWHREWWPLVIINLRTASFKTVPNPRSHLQDPSRRTHTLALSSFLLLSSSSSELFVCWSRLKLTFDPVIVTWRSSKMKLLELILILALAAPNVLSMIITSVFAGPKKYKSITFDLFPIPLSYAVKNKNQFAYRGHYTLRRPNFNVNMAVPVSLPLNFNPVQTGENDVVANLNDDGYQNAASDEENQPIHALEEDQPVEEVSESDGHQSSPEPVKYPEYEVQGGEGERQPTPYTGKAQVSSFIDNGQFVNAHSPVPTNRPAPGTESVMEDEAFGDGEVSDSNYSDERSGIVMGFAERLGGHPDIRRKSEIIPIPIPIPVSKGKTISLGYEEFGQKPTHHPLTVHARHPDSLPWGMTDMEDIHKYYSTFQFTDSLRVPYQRRRGLFSAGFILG